MIRLQIVLNGFKEEYFKKDTLFIEFYREQWIKNLFRCFIMFGITSLFCVPLWHDVIMFFM